MSELGAWSARQIGYASFGVTLKALRYNEAYKQRSKEIKNAHQL